MSPRTGKPKSDNPKDIDVKVGFDKELHERLVTYCQEHGITRTEAICKGVHLLWGKKK